MQRNGRSGFTIIELLVVIVVIGILAAITIVAYTGISQRATIASLQSDLTNGSKLLKLYYVDHGTYPVTIDGNNCPTGPSDTRYCLKPATGNTYTYSSSSPYSAFTLDAAKASVKYRITNDTTPVAVVTPTGLLTALSPLTIGTDPLPMGIAISADGTSVYAVNTGSNSNTVSMYNRNTSTGALTALSPPTIATDGTTQQSAKNVAISADGTSVYVTNYNSNTVSMYSRDVGTGLLTVLGTPTIATGSHPRDLAISVDGTSVYVTNESSDNISMYSRDTGSGLLTAIGTATTMMMAGPRGIVISVDGTSVYTGSYGYQPTMFSRNTSTGALTALNPATIAAGSHPEDLTISADGHSVYVVNNSSYTISMYSRDTGTGALTALSPSTIATGSVPKGIVTSADGTSVYVANSNSATISMYSRDTSTGALTAMGTPIATSWNICDLAISADGRSVYVTNTNFNNISMYSRQ